MNYFNFHIGDYTSHTKHLTPIEDICYRRLLDLYYMTEEAIPSDIDKVSRLISMRDHREVVAEMLSEFFTPLPNGEWFNERASKEIERFQEKANRARRANISRWEKPSEKKQDDDSDLLLISEGFQIPTNNQEPITNNKKKEATSASFDRFWTEYPKKTGKANAYKEWQKLKPDIQIVLHALTSQKQWRANATPGEFIPAWKDPQRWIRGECWYDEITEEIEADAWAGATIL
jgi:uncharacterized protein YdaU (DUF1376 family)